MIRTRAAMAALILCLAPAGASAGPLYQAFADGQTPAALAATSPR